MSPFAQASLIEARKLVTEARVSLECVDHEGSPENASDDISEDSGLLDSDHGLETQNENNVLYQDNKPVNGIKFPPSNGKGIGFHFDVSAFTGINLLFVRTLNPEHSTNNFSLPVPVVTSATLWRKTRENLYV